ncbi:MAG: hypothetical protein AAFU49_04755 [Pseudomonadota bacterium]
MRLALLAPLATLLLWQIPGQACTRDVETTPETLARATEHAIAIAEVRIASVTPNAAYVDPAGDLRRPPLHAPTLIEVETLQTLSGEHRQSWHIGAWSVTTQHPRLMERLGDLVGERRIIGILHPFERDPDYVDRVRDRGFAPEEVLPALKGSDGKSLPRLAAIPCGEFVLIAPDRWPAQ